MGCSCMFQVGDIISVIDMPPSDDTIWWRGKRGFEVRFCFLFAFNFVSSMILFFPKACSVLLNYHIFTSTSLLTLDEVIITS